MVHKFYDGYDLIIILTNHDDQCSNYIILCLLPHQPACQPSIPDLGF